jgi:hypothetical protein
MRLVAVAAAALALAPAAMAWTPVPGGVQNSVVPSMLETAAGSTLVSFESPLGNTISVARNHAAPKVVVASDPIVGQTQLIQQPSGAIQLYFPNLAGVARLTSSDDGQTWTGPVQTKSNRSAGVSGAAVAPDGTPYFVQEGTGYVMVSRGLNGETSSNVFTRCCGYAASLAIDTGGLVQVAFYSNADPDGATVYEQLSADLTPATPTVLKPVAQHEAPLVADRTGNVFLAWAPGYPTATALSVVPFRGGGPSGDGVTFRGAFSGPEPHVALALDAADRLWAVWTQGGTIRAARSRSHGLHFGATVAVAEPGTVYQLAAAGVAAGVGSADVVVNTGTALVAQTLHPGLSVRVYTRGRATWAQALDDGIGVSGTRLRIGGRTITTNASGAARVPRGRGSASAPGYVSASFRVP